MAMERLTLTNSCGCSAKHLCGCACGGACAVVLVPPFLLPPLAMPLFSLLRVSSAALLQ